MIRLFPIGENYALTPSLLSPQQTAKFVWNYAGIVSRFVCEKRYEGKMGNTVNI